MPRPRPRRGQPEPPPEFLIDRSLGYHQVPDALRAKGLLVHTLRSAFGGQAEQHLPDEVWLERAGREGWVVLAKDDAIRRRPLELAALRRHGTRMFCLTNANLRGDEQVAWLLGNLNRILQRARKPGPWVCGVYADRIMQLWPKP